MVFPQESVFFFLEGEGYVWGILMNLDFLLGLSKFPPTVPCEGFASRIVEENPCFVSVFIKRYILALSSLASRSLKSLSPSHKRSSANQAIKNNLAYIVWFVPPHISQTDF